ncbi:lipase family protein [Mycobacterium sp. ACS4331]|uniref:alpha/beta hydrolase family protein n=1 Tax=Mycobacterium sp. ACS4331 TaxID=1834121 RepID=UPI0007FE6E65|nr:lipase family protein [Mycobacterium sp. ACS4331]OBF25030.1 lipase [Mycobacterium sp. ACS4331]
MSEHVRRWSAVVAAVAVLTGCTAHRDPELHPGQLLTARPLTTSAALPGGQTQLITYVSDDSHGEPIVVSGTVSVPTSPPPDGGWPVVSWAHGTTGYADTCAPSADTPDGLVHDYVGVVHPMLDSWLTRGYAVVQTDYQGLGTPGGHPYVDGVSEANTVTDIVRAARNLDSSIGTDWVVIGHSQGGQAALFTAQDGEDRAPELNLLAAVSIAPGGVGFDQAVDLIRTGRPEVQAAQRFLPLLVLGAAVVDPSIDPDRIFSNQARPLLTTARTECVGQVNALPLVPPGQVFAPDAELDGLQAHLARQDPTGLTPRVPVMLVQGTADAAVSPAGVDDLAKALCDKDVTLDYRVYAGQDHRGVIGASLVDVQNFVDAVRSGQAPGNCPG